MLYQIAFQSYLHLVNAGIHVLFSFSLPKIDSEDTTTCFNEHNNNEQGLMFNVFLLCK